MIAFKIQSGFWPKWDGEGDPSGPVFWEDEPEGGGFETNEAARTALCDLCQACDYDINRFRIVPVVTP